MLRRELYKIFRNRCMLRPIYFTTCKIYTYIWKSCFFCSFSFIELYENCLKQHNNFSGIHESNCSPSNDIKISLSSQIFISASRNHKKSCKFWFFYFFKTENSSVKFISSLTSYINVVQIYVYVPFALCVVLLCCCAVLIVYCNLCYVHCVLCVVLFVETSVVLYSLRVVTWNYNFSLKWKHDSFYLNFLKTFWNFSMSFTVVLKL